MHNKSCTIKRLPIHLGNQQTIIFYEGKKQEAINKYENKETLLTAYYKLYQIDIKTHKYTYVKIPLNYVFNNNKWNRRIKTKLYRQ